MFCSHTLYTTLTVVLRCVVCLFAHKHTGGRLVFWMPSSRELYSEAELPQHPMLQLLDNSEQILTSRYSRRLITMVKTKPYDAEAAAEFKRQRQGFVMALDRLSELVYSKEAAAAAAAAAAGSGDSSSGAAGEQQQLTRGGIPKYRGKHN